MVRACHASRSRGSHAGHAPGASPGTPEVTNNRVVPRRSAGDRRSNTRCTMTPPAGGATYVACQTSRSTVPVTLEVDGRRPGGRLNLNTSGTRGTMVTSRLVVPSAARAVSEATSAGDAARSGPDVVRNVNGAPSRPTRTLAGSASADGCHAAPTGPFTPRPGDGSLPPTSHHARCDTLSCTYRTVRICGRSAVYAGEAQASPPSTSAAAAIASPVGRETNARLNRSQTSAM